MHAAVRTHRCLVEEAGDVAFVKHTTVQDVLDSAPGWATGRSRSNFRLMCPDGTTKPVDQFLKCHLAKVCTNSVALMFHGKYQNPTG